MAKTNYDAMVAGSLMLERLYPSVKKKSSWFSEKNQSGFVLHNL
jgi:hypothetical protein